MQQAIIQANDGMIYLHIYAIFDLYLLDNR